MKDKQKKILARFIKVAVVIFAFWFIYRRLSHHDDLSRFVKLVDTFSTAQISFFISLVFLLMLVNWVLEAVKWKKLIKRVEELSLWQAIESVFCGLTWAVFTPNRIGEYGGRIFFLSPRRRITGVVAMAVGNLAQLVLTNVFGAISALIFVYHYVPIEKILFLTLCGLAIVFISFFLIFYFNVKWVNSLLLSIRFTRKFKKFYAVLGRYRKRELAKILLLSLARYSVFTSQYVILFAWLIPDIPINDVLLLIPILFFVQSSLPSLDLLDIGVRSVTALFFFKYVTQQDVAVVAVISSIWFINIIIPAILGTFFVFKTNIFKVERRS